MSHPGPQPADSAPAAPRSALRVDGVKTREDILAAAEMLAGDRAVSMIEIAAAAGVGRSRLYRHFATREALRQALAERAGAGQAAGTAGEVVTMPFRSPGQLGRDRPLALEVTHVLDEVPPHLVPDQLVAEARRAGGVAVALYVVDIDGSHLLRLAGSEEFPDSLADPPALGPELVPEGLPGYQDQLRRRLPGCVCEPLWLRGRVTGLLLCMGTPLAPLDDIARQGAAALELANDYTDYIEAARRHKKTTAAAEIQQNLLPPRIVRIQGAQLAGGLLPTYEVGGDWFDFVDNRDGAWLAIADAAGTGPTAAGLGAAALGSLQAARRSGYGLQEALQAMHETVRCLGNPDFYVSALVARWRAATQRLTWVNCGHPPAYLADTDANLTELQSPHHTALGVGDRERTFDPIERTLRGGERVILVTDGVIQRRPKTEAGSASTASSARSPASSIPPPPPPPPRSCKPSSSPGMKRATTTERWPCSRSPDGAGSSRDLAMNLAVHVGQAILLRHGCDLRCARRRSTRLAGGAQLSALAKPLSRRSVNRLAVGQRGLARARLRG